jgi:hypothetical protein
MRIFLYVINAFFWLWLFLIPAMALGFLALWLYARSPDNLIFSILISVAGIISGYILAEFIRKRYGLDNFFGRRLATPDIDAHNSLDNEK